MSYKFIFEPRAVEQYLDALEWYTDRSREAGVNFADAIANRLQDICSSPLLYRNTKANFREAIVKKFPYLILYRVDEVKELIVVAAVFHQSRDPKKKFK